MSQFANDFRNSVAERTVTAETARRAAKALDLQEMKYREDKENICPSCGGTSWHVGRVTAECASCDTPVQIANRTASLYGGVTLIDNAQQTPERGRFVINGRF
jgi:ribosomal protein L37E